MKIGDLVIKKHSERKGRPVCFGLIVDQTIMQNTFSGDNHYSYDVLWSDQDFKNITTCLAHDIEVFYEFKKR